MITSFKELRDYLEPMAAQSNNYPSKRAKYVSAMSLIQIAQELNEIKQVMVSQKVRARREEIAKELEDVRDFLWPSSTTEGRAVVDTLLFHFKATTESLRVAKVVDIDHPAVKAGVEALFGHHPERGGPERTQAAFAVINAALKVLGGNNEEK